MRNMKDRLRTLEIVSAPCPLNRRQIEADAATFRLKMQNLADGFNDNDAELSPESWGRMSIASQVAWGMRFPKARRPV